MAIPKAPTDLRPAGPGRRLWRDTVAAWDLTPPELATLAEAARTVDELETIRTAVVDAPATVLGSTGQPRPNPLYAEARAHRESASRLLGSLHLPADTGAAPVSGRSAAASKAAGARWDAERRKAEHRDQSRRRTS